ncbi:hypothetical protein CWI37_0084p0010 [Hamiltosporidium tvaerminnensis]|uniref:Uncharacterized protein n=1 Tax=Hamiltosporidium tvaerminnensis TaxID=1176355 RepID=A0A4Q9LCM9_9MICR|nr:hypothetical protein CWI37_0084p0010 [Hamiltosporidium tvaerminnensis]
MRTRFNTGNFIVNIVWRNNYKQNFIDTYIKIKIYIFSVKKTSESDIHTLF